MFINTLYSVEPIATAVAGGSAAVLEQILKAFQLHGVQLTASAADLGLCMVIMEGHKHLLQQLFDAGADRHAALLCAAKASARSAPAREALQDLLSAGVPVDAAHEQGRTALRGTICGAMLVAAGEGSVEGVRMLLAAGADIGARDGRRPALEFAACIGSDPAIIDCCVQHFSPQQLTAAVLVKAAGAVSGTIAARSAGLNLQQPRTVEALHKAAFKLLQAAIERSDPQSVYAAQLEGASGSYAGDGAFIRGSLGMFAQVMLGMWSKAADELEPYKQDLSSAVQLMCVRVAEHLSSQL
jgi:hypothetical protein